jgi:hypothetical protein
MLATFAVALAPTLRAAWNDLGPVRELGAGATPGIAVDPAGTVHVVFMHDGAILHRQAGRDAEFAAAERVPVPEGPAAYNSPHLVCDALGTLHLAFTRDVTGAGKKVWYAAHRDGKWTQPVLAIDHSTTERRANYPRLAVASNGATAYLSAFAGGGSTIVRLDHLTTAARETARVETPLWVAHPLLESSGDMLAVGRAGASGHKLQRYSPALEARGEPLLLSRGTPTKTFEATAAIIDERGIVHVAGLTQSPVSVLWYTTEKRARNGKAVVLGPEVGAHASERVYPVLLRDGRGRVTISYRDHATGESKLTIIDPDGERFATPIVIAPAITSRLRWNAHLAAAPDGGAFIVWDAEGRMFFRSVGEAAAR